MRVIQRGEELRLAPEARDAFRIVAEAIRHEFDRDVPSKLRVVGTIDFAHPAAAERRDDFIGAEAKAGF